MSIDATALAEAIKKLRAEKPQENFMVVSFDGGDVRLILPHKDGVALMNSLANAEMFIDNYRSDKGIHPFKRDSVEATLMSVNEYQTRKIAQLLGVSYDDVLQAQKTPPT